jgi:KaiC/GvpD/RAD55 family RecA-like ATPase
LPKALSLPFLNELVPGGLPFGSNYVVEFDPDSFWYEASLTMTAQALRQDTRVEYHTFQHLPGDVRKYLSDQRLSVDKLELKGSFRIWDTYTRLTGLDLPAEPSVGGMRWEIQKPSFLSDLTEDMAKMLREGVPEGEKRWLHIDDDTSVLNRFVKEQEVINVWQTRIAPYVRARELISFHSLMRGLASEGFYKQFEASCDGIIDFKTEEEKREIERFARVRSLRGKNCDSRWRRLRLLDDGQVELNSRPVKENEIGIGGWLKGPKK